MSGTKGTDTAVAVIGVGCRLPGGITDMNGLWQALEQGSDLVGQVPPDRFDADRFVDEHTPRPGKSYTRAGGFLDDIAGFDAAYFKISPKEAAAMDPQQRLLLEMTAEALDDAGVDPAGLAGSDTAVFVGISDTSYGFQQMLEKQDVTPYTMAGATLSIAANRISHTFDLHGPSMAVDTACSSSLLAVERAYRTLLAGTSRLALAGGVNVLVSPGSFTGFSQAQMLSPTGRCAAFSAGADGFVRAEGGGVVVLKRLADALADGDRVHGVIVGAGTNNDGRTMGLALPNPEAQEALLRQVYGPDALDPDDLVYVEAHGTGTQAGDPAECEALGRVLGRGRARGPLPIGSVKSNLGHLEPASGMPGLFKALLVLRHGRIPASLHAEELNPRIDFDGLNLSVATRATAVSAPGGGRALAGVNSFGFGGSNVHVTLTTPPPPARLPGPAPSPGTTLPVLVSARTDTALRQAIERTADRLTRLGDDEEAWYDCAYTSTRRRGGHPRRAVALADSPAQAARALRGLLADQPRTGGPERAQGPDRTAGPQRAQGPGQAASSEQATGQEAQDAERGRGVAAVVDAAEHGRVVFVFSGNGSQWAGMGADLLATDETFRAAVREADAALRPYLGWSVLREMERPPRQWRLSATEVAQPLLFAVQAGLLAVLRAAGVHPEAVLGHSVGEVAAAYAAGALSLEQAARVIAARGTAQAATMGTGRMAAVGLPEERARAVLARCPDVEVAAVNTDRDVTLAGPEGQLKQLGADLEADGVFVRHLDLDYPFHSAAMDAVREPLLRSLDGLRPRSGGVTLLSTVTGRELDGSELTAGYWWRNVREPVRFADAVDGALAGGHDVFVEVGPHPVLRSYLRRMTARARRRACVVPTLRREQPAAVPATVAEIIAAGAQLDWDAYFPRPGRVVSLPPYPWQRERYWIGGPDTWVRSSGTGALQHPLLGERLPAPHPTWHGPIERTLAPWLVDHRAGGVPVLPVTGYIEMALSAARLAMPEAGEAVEVDRAAVTRALVIPESADARPLYAQTSLTPETGAVVVTSTDDLALPPQEHFRARVRLLLRPCPPPLDLAALRARVTAEADVDAFYRDTARGGMAYGPSFRVLTGLRLGEGEVLAAYSVPAQAEGRYHVHPVLLDSALQAGVAWLVETMLRGNAFMPSAIGAVRVWRAPAAEGVLHVRERARGDDEVCWDILVADPDGTVTVEVEGCRLRRTQLSTVLPLEHFRTELRALPHENTPAAPWPLAGPVEIVDAVAGRLADLRSAWRALDHGRFADRAEASFAVALAAALEDVDCPAGREIGVTDLVRAGVTGRGVAMVQHALPLLERHGLARRLGEARFELAGPHRDGPAAGPAAGPAGRDGTAAFFGQATPFAAEQALTALCVRHLVPVLLGEDDPAELLHSGGGAELLDQVHDIAPLCLHGNRLIRALAGEIAARWPADRPLRVVEVGAGTGGTAAMLLPVLPADRTRYLVTDVDEVVLARAQRRLAGSDVVEFRRFDLDAGPAEQGLPPGSFDLVIAAHTLHRSADLAGTLARLSGLLVPGGLLLAVEPHRPPVAAYAGMLPGYWGNADRELRPHSPLVEAGRWPQVLAEAGYREVAHLTDDDDPGRAAYSLLLAAAAGTVPAPQRLALDAAQTWIVIAGHAENDADDPSQVPAHDRAPALAEGPAHGHALADALGDLIAGQGHVERAGAGEDAARLLGRVPQGATAVTFVLVVESPAGRRGAACPPEAVVEEIAGHIATVRAVAQACAQLPPSTAATLWLVTDECAAVPCPGPGGGDTPVASAVWGATRTLANEQPRLTIRRVSAHRGGGAAERVYGELARPGHEDEIVLTGQGRFVPRTRHTPARPPRPAEGGGHRLAVRDPGPAYRLVWEPLSPPSPGPGQVLVELRAAGLNFRDLVHAVNLLPGEALEGFYGGFPLGLEGAGVVAAVGPDVTGVRPGDRVMTAQAVGLGTHAVVPAWAIMPVPGRMSFTEAASMPMAHLTAHAALRTAGRLRAGETVLVHSGAGGVGLAAIQYGRRVGARVIATAGTRARRDFLRAHGVEHVYDSRSLDFAEQIMELTGGRGVDVVLNSLIGEALIRSMEILAHGGRFIEIGKRDIFADHRLPMRPFGNNTAFIGLDVGTLITQEPDRSARVMAELAGDVTAGRVTPLPHTVYPASRVADAFAAMRHSRHIGKIVVSFGGGDESVLVEAEPRAPRFDPRGTYLVSGGLGGFGAATARWLAARGARRLALVGRRGIDSPEAAGLLRDLAELGADTHVYAADVSDRAAMTRVVQEARAEGRPLRGVVHAAMHLDDGQIGDLTDDRIAPVLQPKIAGALVLDDVTRQEELDLFLLYSSVTTTLGHVGQTSYVAANQFMEALARRRRARGLPALAVCLGALAQTGVVARGAGDRLAAFGVEAISPREAFTAIEDMLAGGADVAGVGRCDWSRLRQVLPALDRPRMSPVMPASMRQEDVSPEQIARELEAMDAGEVLASLTEHIPRILASILQMPAEQIAHDRKLEDYGMDSLMGAQVLASLRHQYGIDIPPMEILRSGGTVADLAGLVLERLRPQAARDTAAPGQ
ncbi:SDR family NAD(P)-dependent oxidoreductase [Nonomuraea sp. B10E15]|uniref:SDR family NAD(P)-dependent oxidoreductase n=1 Tax=Nonomuraea sp. B10E15 TaxID=3153560 RepID=UPI00325EC096